MKRSITLLLLLVLSTLLTSGCVTIPKGDNAQDKRAVIQQMKNDTLLDLYAMYPQSKDRIQRAIGYAVFSNVGLNFYLVTAGGGWGITHDNKSSKEFYMKMVYGGIGPGMGIKDFRGIFVFKSAESFTDFKENGWIAGLAADIVAKSEAKGGGAGGAISVSPDIDLYQLTKNGLAIQATIQGSKYYLDNELNQQ
jgi:lipid-binding SYLF domain-containing protein